MECEVVSKSKEVTDDIANETRCVVFLRTPKCSQVREITDSSKTCVVPVTVLGGHGGRARDCWRPCKLESPRWPTHSQGAQQEPAPRLGEAFSGSSLWTTGPPGWTVLVRPGAYELSKQTNPRFPSKTKPHIEEKCWDSIQMEQNRALGAEEAEGPMQGRNRTSGEGPYFSKLAKGNPRNPLAKIQKKSLQGYSLWLYF